MGLIDNGQITTGHYKKKMDCEFGRVMGDRLQVKKKKKQEAFQSQPDRVIN